MKHNEQARVAPLDYIAQEYTKSEAPSRERYSAQSASLSRWTLGHVVPLGRCSRALSLLDARRPLFERAACQEWAGASRRQGRSSGAHIRLSWENEAASTFAIVVAAYRVYKLCNRGTTEVRVD